MDQENRNKQNASNGGERKRPVRYDENGRPIPPKKRPVQYDENGQPIPPKKRPVQYDENGHPIPPKKRPVQYDENGKPMPPKKRPIRYDENGQPIPPSRRPAQYDENGRPIRQRPKTQDGAEVQKRVSAERQSENAKPANGYDKFAQMETQIFDRRAFDQEEAVEANKRKRKKNRTGLVLTIVQAVVSVVFFVMLLILGMLPTKFLVVIGLILLILLSFTLLSQRTRSGRKVGWVYAIIISVILSIGSIYIWKAHDVIEELTSNKQTTKLSDVSVIVMQDSPADGLEDLAGKRFGVQKLIDKENTELTLDDLKAKFNSAVSTIEYESLKSQVQALYSGKVDAIIINEIYRSLVLEDFPNFNSETRVLEGFTYTKVIEETSKADIKVDTDPFNVYLSGNDAWGAVTLADGRTDVNIIATVNPKTKQILLTTTPRDYYVELPFYSGCMDKLTHAGLYGIDTSMETLENLYDIDLDYYVRINFSGFQNIVDALGGVNVYSECEFQSVDGKWFYEGYNYLNGYDALLFVRERYAFANGDLQRGRNQMLMIKAMAEKIFSPSILTNYMGLMNSLSSCFITDMPSDKIADLVKMQLNDGAEWNIVSNSVLGYGSSMPTYSGGSERLSVLKPSYEDIEVAKALIQSCMNGEIIKAPEKDYAILVLDQDDYTDDKSSELSSFESTESIDESSFEESDLNSDWGYESSDLESSYEEESSILENSSEESLEGEESDSNSSSSETSDVESSIEETSSGS